MTFIIVIAGITQFLVSLFVLFRRRNNLSNIFFFAIGISALCWALANYLTINFIESENLILLVRLILFFVVLQNTAFYLFTSTFPRASLQISITKLIVYLLFTAGTALLTLSPFVFTSVTIEEGLPITVAGPGILVFIIHAAYSIINAFKRLYKKQKHSIGTEKKQFQILLFASFLIWIVVPVTNFAITPLLKTTFFIEFSPIYTFAFASIIAYAMVAQKLFDIRAAVARSVAYVLSLGFIGLVYGAIIFLLFSVVNFGNISDFVERATFVGFALVTATAYPVTKRYFDKLTNKLFYQDVYDSQEFLNQLNKELVSNIDIELLLKKCAQIIDANLKSEYCLFGLKETAYSPQRVIGTVSKDFHPEDVQKVRALTPHLKQNIFAADELEESSEVKQAMQKYDIAILGRLATDSDLEIEGLGYLLLGNKKSGNSYNKHDLKMIDIITNELVIAVQNALRFEEIQKFNITLQDRVDSATAELQRTNEKLKEIDETKDEFISMASHQLRTPLTSVKGYLSMVLEGDVGKVNKQQNKMLEQAYLSSQRMVYLIADLLNVSRLKTGKFIIEAKETNLADVVEAEVEQLKPTAKSRDLTLSFKKPKDFPTLTMDETKIRQVIMNFIDNAIYYTPAGGKITVTLEDKGKTIEYRVEDSGIGVPKAEQHNLFSKFYRAVNARKARPDGTGLGLFMAKKVVVAQGGAVIFESEEGKGSTFGFSFAKEVLIPPKTK